MSADMKDQRPKPPADRLKVVSATPENVVARPQPAEAPAVKAPGAPAVKPPVQPMLPGDPGAQRRKKNPGKVLQAARRRSRRSMILSLALCVGLPTLFATLYYAFIASDQFAAEARFSVRGNEVVSTDIMSVMTGAGASSTNVADSFIVQEFIKSREIVDSLQPVLDIRGMYDRPDADWWARFPRDRPVEEFVEYWSDMVGAQFDSYSGILTLQVRAFRPEDAKAIASGVLAESEKLVNRLSEKARSDTVTFAQREVEFAEWRLRDARSAVTAFRNRESIVDPAAAATANQSLIAELEGQLSAAEAELQGLRTLVNDQSPSVRILKTRIAAIKSQIEAQKGRITAEPSGGGAAAGDGGGQGSISGQLADYQDLVTTQEFAEKAYATALAGLEKAQADAKRTHRYLATFVSPAVPQYAEYPSRITNVLVVLICAFAAWTIGSLLVAAIKDHVA